MKELYLEICKKHLPRLLSMYDLDPFSKTRGYGDREFWGWKSRDYCNASLQGGVLTLAAMVKLGQFRGQESRIVEIIKSIIEATSRIKYKNHSVDEIMPYEKSFCVAASLVVDILYAIEFLEDYLSQAEKYHYFKLCKNLIHFYANNVESHGIISNHLAAGVAGIVKYQKMTGDYSFNDKGRQILEIIYKHQSSEGWYREYEGADPGYQTLCTYYLAIIYQLTYNPRLLKSLASSLEFISYCIHPDGSIGGEYGSRNTQIYYPAGFEMLRNDIKLAGRIADFMGEAIQKQDTVTLDVVDNGNFVPFINNYMIAHFESQRVSDISKVKLPFEDEAFNEVFWECGLYLINRPKYYAVVGIKKGGLFKVFKKQPGELILDDCGYIGLLDNGRKVSTQMYSEKAQFFINNNQIELGQNFYTILGNLPTPLKFIILRLLNITLMKVNWFNKVIKDLLVKILITNKRKQGVQLKRKIVFNDVDIVVIDEIYNNSSHDFKWLDYGKKFSSIHMASSKYYNKHYLGSNWFYLEPDVVILNQTKKLSLCNTIYFGDNK